MKCPLCRVDFPMDLIRPNFIQGRPVCCCPMCDVANGGAEGMNWRRALLHLQAVEREAAEAELAEAERRKCSSKMFRDLKELTLGG